jgi:chemotaxis protein MotB
MARKKKHPEHVNHERWLVSYADFVTLLFAFFTALYAMGQVDSKKASAMTASTRAAFNLDFFPDSKPVLGMSQPIDQMEMSAPARKRERSISAPGVNKNASRHSESDMQLQQFRKMVAELNKTISTKNLKGLTVSNNKYGVVISLKDVVFFDPAKSGLKRTALPALDAIAESLLQSHLELRIEGHTDGSMVRSGRFRSNWELSTARAASVVDYFIEQFAYPPDQLSVAGFASTRPLNRGDSPEARASNRRVDIVVLMPKKDWLPTPSEVNAPESPANSSSEKREDPVEQLKQLGFSSPAQ